MRLAAGTALGPYRIVDLVGSGGMGEVYRARDERLRRDVALKVLRPGPGADAARLLREARVVSTLADPHIVTVYDVGEADGVAFVAMELVDGAPLTRRVRPGGLAVDELLRIAIDVAAGLARAHAAGVVHRDLKPANVMITASGSAKILDFGLATTDAVKTGDTSTFAAVTGPGVVAGTVGYMAPEQAEGRAVDARADVFSFGVVLYELATGRRPFDRDSGVATLAAILRDPVPPLSGLRPDVPAAFTRLVERCLRKEPERRFHAVADILIALEDVRDDVSRGPSDAAGTGSASTPLARRWPLRAAAAFLAAAAGAGAIASLRPAVSPPLTGLDLMQLTFDVGYSGTPALSPDGTLLAFASDRGGEDNLDIWVQPVAGGQAIQVTDDAADERTPAFTADGGRIVFRSERDGGGIYSVPALGGEPRLLVAGGLSPRVSPDGRQVAYWTGSFIGFGLTPGGYRTFVVDIAGGTPREITGFTNSRFPVWSPDGGSLIVSATQAEKPDASTYDWWIAPLAGGAPVATGARALLGRAASDVSTQASPSTWTGDRVLTSWRGDLWAVVLTGPNRTAAGIERLTFGPGAETEPAATVDGTVAFADAVSRLSIWSLPIDTEQARLLGPLRKVTPGTGPFLRATLSADERRAAFFGPGRPPPSILVQDLSTGKIRDLGSAPGAVFGPVISPDGLRVAYPTGGNGVRVVSVGGGAPSVLCPACQDVGDWTADSQQFAVVTAGRQTGLGLLDTRTGTLTVVAEAPPNRSLNRPSLSPDNRWIAFRVMAPESQTVYLAPFRRPLPIPADAWLALGAPERDLRPVGWSPSGRMLYLLSARDGFRCLYVQRVDPASGRPLGAATVVKHMHNVRAPGGGGGSVVSTGAGNAVGRQQILFDFPEQEVNVWQMRLGVLTPPGATPP
ncbi:MAG: protein kinase [Vicinamibacterales bacterium]